MRKRAFSILLVFIASATAGSGLKCYDCDSSDQKNCIKYDAKTATCSDPKLDFWNTVFSATLPNTTDFLCANLARQDKSIRRICAPVTLNNESFCKAFKKVHANTECTTCKTDFCNGMEMIEPRMFLHIVSFIGIIVAYKISF